MPERDAHDEGSQAPTTPRVSGEVPSPNAADETPMPGSSTRLAALESEGDGAPSMPGDTLLSAGKPAQRLEVLLEDRLGAVDQKFRELEERLRLLEAKKPAPVPEARPKPWLWVVFLVAIAAMFQLLRLAE